MIKETVSGAKDRWLTWKIIKLGGLKVIDEIHRVLERGGFRVGCHVNEMLGRMALEVVSAGTEVGLVRVTIAELGFKNGAACKDIYKRALELGLMLCPVEVGIQLRLQYKDQSRGEYLRIAMEPLIGSDGGPYVFGVDCDKDGFWLRAICCLPTSFCSADSVWVFCK